MKFGKEAFQMSPIAAEPDNLDSERKGETPLVPNSQEQDKALPPSEQINESKAVKEQNIELVKDELAKMYAGTESKERHEFTLEEIRGLLKKIDGKEHPDLTVGERIENIKGELMSLTFMSGEKEMLDGEDREISYLLTLAGQRYKSDGTEGRFVSQTFLTKDYDEGMYLSEQLADHVEGEWTNFTPVAESTSNIEQKRILAGEVLLELNEKGVEDLATKELLTRYAMQCEQEWETKMAGDTNAAHLECALELAELYGQSEKYKEYAIESLEEILLGVEAGGEMEERILNMLKNLGG